MYFSLPKCIPPRPLGGTRVRKQWSALYYFIAYYNTSHARFKKNINHVVIVVVIIIYTSNAIVVIIINIYKKCHCCLTYVGILGWTMYQIMVSMYDSVWWERWEARVCCGDYCTSEMRVSLRVERNEMGTLFCTIPWYSSSDVSLRMTESRCACSLTFGTSCLTGSESCILRKIMLRLTSCTNTRMQYCVSLSVILSKMAGWGLL